MTIKWDHFKEKDVYKHLQEARAKGSKIALEPHEAETRGHIEAATGTVKETSIVLLSLWILLTSFGLSSPLLFLLIFSIGWILWKVGRTYLLGWGRLQRLHRLIEQEKWEIHHHRMQEKEELRAMYEQKGFSGQLLDQVVEVLMADDNRLLRVMLEEELGLTLESFEHPLKQAVGAGTGAILASSALFIGILIGGSWGPLLLLLTLFAVATLLAAKREGSHLMHSLIWDLAVGTLSIGSLYLIS